MSTPENSSPNSRLERLAAAMYPDRTPNTISASEFLADLRELIQLQLTIRKHCQRIIRKSPTAKASYLKRAIAGKTKGPEDSAEQIEATQQATRVKQEIENIATKYYALDIDLREISIEHLDDMLIGMTVWMRTVEQQIIRLGTRNTINTILQAPNGADAAINEEVERSLINAPSEDFRGDRTIIE
ncbi:hypothetical protein HOF56_00910 [Candidatus Peribacteria bacterium]|jgi:hypothetical protein|nr:hypothetical protein [Candidatus Peribacteria bacterium]MBT4020861.1 hypothetical protein [Candidatus Peribacteria bacterium]MBT4241150.1 hypothetical protein [Candidatus Peribacteria bacterium]MBT4473872.1 hypothetical protein [Candidatus Peribacteria bacterium]